VTGRCRDVWWQVVVLAVVQGLPSSRQCPSRGTGYGCRDRLAGDGRRVRVTAVTQLGTELALAGVTRPNNARIVKAIVYNRGRGGMGGLAVVSPRIRIPIYRLGLGTHPSGTILFASSFDFSDELRSGMRNRGCCDGAGAVFGGDRPCPSARAQSPHVAELTWRECVSSGLQTWPWCPGLPVGGHHHRRAVSRSRRELAARLWCSCWRFRGVRLRVVLAAGCLPPVTRGNGATARAAGGYRYLRSSSAVRGVALFLRSGSATAWYWFVGYRGGRVSVLSLWRRVVTAT